MGSGEQGNGECTDARPNENKLGLNGGLVMGASKHVALAQFEILRATHATTNPTKPMVNTMLPNLGETPDVQRPNPVAIKMNPNIAGARLRRKAFIAN